MADKNERAAGKDVPAIPNVPLLQRLQAELETYSTADRAIASYILAHYPTLAFETAMTLAAKVGVSEITIGRFTRKLGYRNFKTMKNEDRTSTRLNSITNAHIVCSLLLEKKKTHQTHQMQ